MVAFTTSLPTGFAGSVSRSIFEATIQPETPDASFPLTAYGNVCKIVSGKVRPIASGDAASVITGFLVRPYPTQSTTNSFVPSVPPTTGIVDILKRGYMTVVLAQGTSAKDAAVYVRVTAATGKAVGDIETTADSGNCVAIPTAKFMGPAGSDGIVEVAYNI